MNHFFYTFIYIFCLCSKFQCQGKSAEENTLLNDYIRCINQEEHHISLDALLNYDTSKQIDTQFIKYVKKPYYNYHITISSTNYYVDHIDGGFVSGKWSSNVFLYDKNNNRLSTTLINNESNTINNSILNIALHSKLITRRILLGYFSHLNKPTLKLENDGISIYTNKLLSNKFLIEEQLFNTSSVVTLFDHSNSQNTRNINLTTLYLNKSSCLPITNIYTLSTDPSFTYTNIIINFKSKTTLKETNKVTNPFMYCNLSNLTSLVVYKDITNLVEFGDNNSVYKLDLENQSKVYNVDHTVKVNRIIFSSILLLAFIFISYKNNFFMSHSTCSKQP